MWFSLKSFNIKKLSYHKTKFVSPKDILNKKNYVIVSFVVFERSKRNVKFIKIYRQILLRLS